ncbi:hypothetical protein [Ignicoccus hospitalis]|nr:hypothetical protein [Ignicoccus hospitalis]
MGGTGGTLLAAFLAGWLSIAVAGAVAGLEIGLSPSFPYRGRGHVTNNV